MRSSRTDAARTWECLIVGGGPAGLSAAVYMGRFRRRTIVFDAGDGRWSYGQRNENYLGFPRGVSALRLHGLGQAQAARFGVAFRSAEVTSVGLDGDRFHVGTSAGPHTARTLIWAAGVRDRWPEFAHARRLVGRHLFWCIVCDGWRTRERRLLVLGQTDRAVRTTLQFLTYTRQVTLLADPARGRPSARARARLADCGILYLEGRIRRVPIVRGRAGARKTPVEAVDRVVLEDGRELPADVVFSLYGSTPRTELLRGLPVALARNGHVRIDDKNHTSLERFFAAGDVSNKHAHQVVSAAHEGAMAAQAANQLLYPASQRL
jgi:thioredoxin reductase (NADPH)